jgi:hypothetical protein
MDVELTLLWQTRNSLYLYISLEMVDVLRSEISVHITLFFYGLISFFFQN